MPDVAPDSCLPARSTLWKWSVCGLLFLATVINYMDRQTLSQTAKNIKDELRLNNEEYGNIEFAFGVAFALGAVAVGWTADRWNVYWIYPVVLLGWSMAGFATGFVQSYLGLLFCRVVLGGFESGNWPCALRTTQRILVPAERTMGNGILQSGAAIGAIVTPLIVEVLVTGPGTWPHPFRVIGLAGTVWVFLWLAVVRREDLALRREGAASTATGSEKAADRPGMSFLAICRDRRFWICAWTTVMINATWHFFRVWLPLFLREDRQYSQSEVNYFTSAYYLATDAGSLLAGFTTLRLARGGMTVHGSRVLVFFAYALLTTLSFVVAVLPAGPELLGLLLIVGFGSLGLFPIYYALSQEMSVRHQGKVTGTLSCTTWMVSALMHKYVGRWLDQTKDYSLVVALAGLAPLLAVIVLAFWRAPLPSRDEKKQPEM
jgi:ACS family hexuronate transporter-like MFS transporter